MHAFGKEEMEAARRVLERRRLFRYMPGAGEADRFERELADRIGTTHAVVVSSGTAALICALAALEVGPGDEVLIPAYGFVADAVAVLAVGAVPVVCEIDDTLTLDPADAEAKLTGHTRALLPAHVNGFACDLDALGALAERNGLALVEDACQAIGGTWHGRPLGSIGDLGAFSFNQYKTLSAGEGGAVVCNDLTLYERAFICHDGSSSFGPHQLGEPQYAGLAFRASELTAAILRAQLAKLDQILASYRERRDALSGALAGVAGLVHIPVHDWDGSCGSCLAYVAEDADVATLLRTTAADAGFDAFTGAAHGHSYGEWELLHERRGGHCDARNPLLGAHVNMGPEGCPRTADVLARTVLVRCTPGPDPGCLTEAIDAVCG